MELSTSGAYRQVIERAAWSQAHGYSIFHITDEDVALGRLFAYGYRAQTVGAFRAARLLLEHQPESTAPRRRAIAELGRLEELSLVPVPADFRVVVATLAAYDRGVQAVLAALAEALGAAGDAAVAVIRDRLVENLNRLTGGDGIWAASDLDVPEQGAFRVPGLTQAIVPLVYGDHHSWNTAVVPVGTAGTTTHRHRQGVEIHLGYSPLHGRTLLGDYATTLREGYAMPIPTMVDHGFDNLGDHDHVLPFIFGSLRLSGWGIFADVEPRLRPVDAFAETPLESAPMNGSVFIERAIAAAAGWTGTRREALIPLARTADPINGGLALGLARVGPAGADFTGDTYRILSIRQGRGRLRLGPVARDLAPHDHVGLPANMPATLTPLGDEPLVLLEATIEPLDGEPDRSRRA